MLKKTDMIKIKNRSKGLVIYEVPDLRIRRQFAPNEIKEVTFEEIQKLSYTTGGKVLLTDCLIINNQEAVEELLGHVEPEYYYTEAEVLELLKHGTLDQLEDCLDFAEQGVIDLVKSIAVNIELNDMSKRELIQKKTGFNVSNAIQINRDTENTDVESPVTHRRAKPITLNTQEETVRKTTPPKYKVTSISE